MCPPFSGNLGVGPVTRLHRNVNITAVVVPFVAFLVSVPLLWNQMIGWNDLAVLAALYLLSGFGITVGFHRLLTHRAFETYRPCWDRSRCRAR